VAAGFLSRGGDARNVRPFAEHKQDVEDRRARFERLWQQYAPAVAAYARRRAPADVVDDAVADTFLVVWRRLDRVPNDPLPWLYGVARLTLANHRRAQARRTALAERLDPEVPADASEQPDARVLEALATLGDGDRELLMLIAWEGLTPAEAAVALDCTAVTCRVRLHRARARLAAALPTRDPPTTRLKPNRRLA
jgi:RNA polymerase sigma-70 factor (ECF subfamily)